MARKRINKTKRVKKTHNTRKTQRLRRKTRRRRNKKGGIISMKKAEERFYNVAERLDKNISRFVNKNNFNRKSWSDYKSRIKIQLLKEKPNRDKILELITECLEYMNKDLTHVSSINKPTRDNPMPKKELSALQISISKMNMVKNLVIRENYNEALRQY
jgi:hypothetical protein